MNYTVFDSPVGKIKIIEEDNIVIEIRFVKDEKNYNPKTEVLKLAKKEFKEYFTGKRKVFTFPIKLDGREFSLKVYKALMEIPYGETCSYKDIAIKIGNENSQRAVGGANNKNKLPIVIPCHRVIGSNGKLVGYAEGLEIKQKLLELERKNLEKDDWKLYILIKKSKILKNFQKSVKKVKKIKKNHNKVLTK